MQLEFDLMAEELIERLEPYMPPIEESDWDIRIRQNIRNVEVVMGIIDSAGKP